MDGLLFFHIGQAGLQIGQEFWNTVLKENNIDENGGIVDYNILDGSYQSMFYENSLTKKLTPRAILIDTDNEIADKIQKKSKLFSKGNFVNGKQDACCIFSRGYRSPLCEEIMEATRKQLENMDHFQGMIFINSTCGGTGSGLFDKLIENGIRMQKGNYMSFSVLPSNNLYSSVLDCYNTVLALEQLRDNDAVVVLQNEIISKNFLNKPDSNTSRDLDFKSINQVISQVVSSLCSFYRFQNEKDCKINKFLTNLVPFRSTNILLSSLYTLEKQEKTTLEITKNLFDCKNYLANSKTDFLKYFACQLIYRGEFDPYDISYSFSEIKTKSPENFEYSQNVNVAISKQNNMFNPSCMKENFTSKNACLFVNSSAQFNIFQNIKLRFDKLYTKRSFVHWYDESNDKWDASIQQLQELLSDDQFMRFQG